jgi:hypothetical protein
LDERLLNLCFALLRAVKSMPKMNNLHASVLLCCFLQGTTLLAQQQKDKIAPASEVKRLKNTISDSSVNSTRQSITNKAKEDTRQLKTSLQQKAENSKQDSIPKPDLKNTTKKSSDLLEKKTSNLQYDSDNPDDAPWKKQQLSKDDLKELDLPGKPKNGTKDLSMPLAPGVALPAKDSKLKEGKPNVDNLKSSALNEDKLRSEATRASGSDKTEKAKHKADSLMEIRDKIEAGNVANELANAKQIYSDKYIQKIYDSLGTKKADSLFKVASELAKTEIPKDELLNKVNAPLKEKTPEGMSFDEKNQSLKMDDADKLQSLPGKASEMDLASMQLPADALAELGPLSGNLVDAESLPVVDSMRQVIVKAKGYTIDEDQMTEEMKKTALRKKPTFFDKSYFEMIVGFVDNTSAVTIVQIAPAWGYHFTDELSVGLGPTVSVQLEERKKINALIGFRSFVKAEFFRQRAYLQIEDNVGQFKLNKDDIGKTSHSLLVGGGGVLPIAKKLGINLAVFYRVNQKDVQPGGSPWVFRIGLSSIKNIGKD